MLTVRASRPTRTSEGVEFLVAELPTGEFSRQLVLGNALDMSGIATTFDAGVLTVTIPVAETAKPRKITVTAGGTGPKVIEGEQQRTAVGSGS